MRFIEGSRCVVGNEFDVKFALREALNNAVIHGNGMDPGKLVDVRCRCERGKGVWPKQLGSAHRRIARVLPQGYGASARGSRGLRWRVEAAGMTRNCPHRMKGRRDTQWQNRAATFGLMGAENARLTTTRASGFDISVVSAARQVTAALSCGHQHFHPQQIRSAYSECPVRQRSWDRDDFRGSEVRWHWVPVGSNARMRAAQHRPKPVLPV